MRTGKRRSAIVIMSRGLPGISGSSFVLEHDRTPACRCPDPRICASATLCSDRVTESASLGGQRACAADSVIC
jgi:hypothetical protein